MCPAGHDRHGHELPAKGADCGDEPTTALDVTIQAQIFELMRDLKNNNDAAILLITHDMGVVAELADNVAAHVYRQHRRSGDARAV